MTILQQADLTLLTPKERSILLLLYRFTCLTSRNIQYLQNHKDHSRINLWLKSLIDQGYVSKTGFTVSAYLLTAHARKEIRKLLNKKSIRYPAQISESMLNTFLYSANVYISLNKTYSLNEQNFTFFTPIDLLEKRLFSFLSPDGFFTYTAYSNKKYFFIEIDNERQTSRTIKKKISRYIMYYDSKSWQKFSPGFFPAICIVSLTKERTLKIKKLCEKVIEENNNIPVIFLCSYLDQFSDPVNRPRWFVSFRKEEYYI